jgi:hypothetical protein
MHWIRETIVGIMEKKIIFENEINRDLKREYPIYSLV